MMYYIVLPFGVVLSLVFCWKRRLGYSVNNLIFKSVSSLCYLLTAVFALISNPQAHTYGSLVIMGGALGLVGDILLDLKGIYKSEEKVYLKGGFIFFLIGVLKSNFSPSKYHPKNLYSSLFGATGSVIFSPALTVIGAIPAPILAVKETVTLRKYIKYSIAKIAITLPNIRVKIVLFFILSSLSYFFS